MKLTVFRQRLTIVRIAIAFVLCALMVGLTVSWYAGSALIAPSPRAIGAPPDDFPAESIALESESGSTIHGWHARSISGRGVVVLLHGIRANRMAMLDRARWLNRLGYSTVLIDFQAHGESPGDHITVGYLEKYDARAAVAFARNEHPGEPIGVIGLSLGGAAALLASPLDIDALVLESVYTDINKAVYNRVYSKLGPAAPVAATLLLAQLRPRLGISPAALRPIDHIAEAGCPVYILSGAADHHTTLADTEALFARAVEPKALWLVDGAAHVDLLNYAPEDYRARVGGFLEHCFREDAPGGRPQDDRE